MQLDRAEVVPIELKQSPPITIAGHAPIDGITAIFIRVETRAGQSAYGCAVAHPLLTGEQPAEVVQTCRKAAQLIPDLHPTNLEYSLAALAPVLRRSPAATSAFDLVFHDLLGLASGMPLYRLLGGYRTRIRASVTIPLSDVEESVEIAEARAAQGFRMLKLKGGLEPTLDVARVQAVHRKFPDIPLQLDADGGYEVREALDLARILEGKLQALEQPTAADDLEGLCQVTRQSPVPILADQSISGTQSALKLAADRAADGLCVKIATCGGLLPARQLDAIARAAGINTMVSCILEPALIAAAGLSFALSSPNVGYCDLDGYLGLTNDPTAQGFRLEDGWLVASDGPGLGCSLELDR